MLDNDILAAWDRESFLHPSTHLGKHARGEATGRIMVGGEGSFVIDRDGTRLLDAFAGLYCVNVGYGRTRIAPSNAATRLASSSISACTTCAPASANARAASEPGSRVTARTAKASSRNRARTVAPPCAPVAPTTVIGFLSDMPAPHPSHPPRRSARRSRSSRARPSPPLDHVRSDRPGSGAATWTDLVLHAGYWLREGVEAAAEPRRHRRGGRDLAAAARPGHVRP